MTEKQLDRNAIRHLIAEEATHWDITNTSESMKNETEWFTFQRADQDDRCIRCGGGMDARQIDLHLANGRVTLHNVVWYVCRTPGCGQTRLNASVEKLVQEIETSVERGLTPTMRAPKTASFAVPV